MSASGDPVRLAASPELPPSLRAMLRTAQDDGATPLEIQRLTARVETALLQPLPVPAEPGLLSGAMGKVATLCVGMATGAGIVWLALGRPPLAPTSRPAPAAIAAPAEQHAGHDTPPTPRPAVAEPTEEARPGDGPPGEPAASLREAVRPEPGMARSALGTPAASPARPPAAEPHRLRSTSDDSPTAPPPSEAELLDAARRALEPAPAEALALTNEHRRHHPRGALAQEREVLAIEALVRLGMKAEAQERAAQLEARFPSSVYLRRVRHLVR